MTPPFNDASTPLSLLLTRRSGKARDLAAPGPSPEQLRAMLAAAMRVPDHGKLAPWRFVEIADRDALQSLIMDAHVAERPDAPAKEREKLVGFAHQAPCLVAVLSVPKESPIPRWEQQLSAGAAIQNLMLAAHAQGFAANWLTGTAAYLDGVARALGGEGACVAGFIFIGTPQRALEERPRPALESVTARWPA